MLWKRLIRKQGTYLTVFFCHITDAFQSESTLYSCMNIKELLARSRREIWILSDCNWTRTQNHLVCKRALNQLAKVWPNGWVFVYKPSGSGFESSCNTVDVWGSYDTGKILQFSSYLTLETELPAYKITQSINQNIYFSLENWQFSHKSVPLSLLQICCVWKNILTIQQNMKLRGLQKSLFLNYLVNWKKLKKTKPRLILKKNPSFEGKFREIKNSSKTLEKYVFHFKELKHIGNSVHATLFWHWEKPWIFILTIWCFTQLNNAWDKKASRWTGS